MSRMEFRVRVRYSVWSTVRVAIRFDVRTSQMNVRVITVFGLG